MTDRDVGARPGEDHQSKQQGKAAGRPEQQLQLPIPPQAEVPIPPQAQTPLQPQAKVARSDRAGSWRPWRTPAASVKPAAPAKPLASAKPAAPATRGAATRDAATAAAPSRLSAPHPRARARAGRRGLRESLGLGRLGSLRPHVAQVQGGGLARPRPRLGRPSLRTLFGLAGLTGVVAVVGALLVTLPSNPAVAPSTGSIYGINWHKTVAPPFGRLDFGPYFTTLDKDLLMLGTVNSKDPQGNSISTSTVWATADGTTWSQLSSSGSFGVGGRRFIAQGLADDGQGGLVAVGNSLGSAATDVTATAWHSRDGTTWTPMEVESGGGQEMIAGVASRPGVAVTAGNGVAWLSTNGISWSAKVLPGAVTTSGSYTPRAVGSFDGGFVIVGLWNGSGPIRSTAWYSPNGVEWKQAKTSLDGFDVTGIAGLNGTIVAVGSDLSPTAPSLAVSWSSTDGITWTKTTAPSELTNVGIDGVARVGDSLIAFGAPPVTTTGNAPVSPAASDSPAGSGSPTGSASPAPSASPVPSGSASTSGSPSASGSASASGSPSAPAGASASPASSGSSGSAPPSGPTLPASTPQPVATEVLWVSEDGVRWLPLANTSAPLYRAHMGAIGNVVVMIGGSSGNVGTFGGALVMGPSRPPASPSAPPAVFALSVDVGNSPMIADVTKDYTLGAVTSSKDRFYVFATGPAGTSIFSSPNGGLWSQEAGPDALTAGGMTGRPVVLQAIPDGSGGIIAIGKITNSSGDNGMVWHMTTAGKWSQAQFQDDTPPEFSSITSGPGLFIVTTDKPGGSPIMYSADGDSWQAGSIAVGDGFALTVAPYRYGYVAVGSDPKRQGATTAWTSPDGRTWTLRTDWKLPPNVTALFGMGNALVALAKTAIPASSAPPPSVPPSAKPTPTPASTSASSTSSTTWWWSATGVVWQQSGLQTYGGDWAIVNNELLVVNPPAKLGGTWTSWDSPDGLAWRKLASNPITFAGSATCTIASNGSQIVIVGWEAPGALKDYLGQFASQ